MKIVRVVCLLQAIFLLMACSEAERPTAPLKPPDEAAAQAALKEINEAQANFIRRTRRYAQTFDELIAGKLLIAEPQRSDTGYDFLLIPSPDAISYKLTATPTTPDARRFLTDQTGEIRSEP